MCRILREKILVVDDEEMICRLILDILGDRYQVETALNVSGALEKFEPCSYDVVVIDLRLPEPSGHMLAQIIRQMDASVAIVLVTGLRLADQDPVLSAFDMVIYKPFTITELEEVIAKAKELHRTRSEASHF